MSKEELNEVGHASVKAGINDAEQTRVEIRDPNELKGQSVREALSHIIRYLKPPPRPKWYIGFTDEFIKMTNNIDRKLQGRVLDAIRDLAKSPDKPKGDTVKPLEGEYKGLWRVRIGD